MSVTASIVCHNTPLSQLRKAVECLLNDKIEKIYIMDNSPDDKLKEIATINSDIIYEHIENKGFGNGHNLAIKQVLEEQNQQRDRDLKSGYHIVMNADIYWNGTILDSMLNFMEDNKKVGVLMPKVYYPDGDLQYSCRMLPTPFDLIFKRFFPKKLVRKRMEKYLLIDHNHDISLNCPYLLGSFLLFRIEALRECGLFDERFFMYPEDIDIVRRIHAKWETLYWPKVRIIHEHGAASRKNLKMLKIHILNMIKYFNKWGWFHDPQRREFNKMLRNNITFSSKENREKGRG